ncbi:MAG: hypothetical protein V4631_22670 [Pseudomonadota bacterium]
MLLHFTSLDYLKGLQKLVSDLINGIVDPLIDLAETQDRDSVLINPKWGNRNTSKNWGNNAWPILKNLQVSLGKDIAFRAMGKFERTAVNECLRGIDQFSLEWTSPEEEHFFKLALETISIQAGNLDDTLSASNDNRWTDYDFAYCYPAFAAQHSKIPKFRVRMDVVGESGSIPPQTGIYISKDDPNAAVQFVWTGANGTTLRNANTFNDIGLAALNYVGREELWFNFNKMFDFATAKQYEALFHDSLLIDRQPRPDLAPSAIAEVAFAERPGKWFLLEVIEGEFEEIASMPISRADEEIRHRVFGGEKCGVDGYYFAPSMMNSRRHFAHGEVTPQFDAKYGQTIWQWDANQE